MNFTEHEIHMIVNSLDESILLCKNRKGLEESRRLKRRFYKYLINNEHKKFWEFWK